MPLTPLVIRSFSPRKVKKNGSGSASEGNGVGPTTSILTRISLDNPEYDEDWVQCLIHENPELVPAADVEPSCGDIIPVVRELPLGGGFLDNLYFTSSGYPVLVEVKLWKNQEARRKVVAQILEYAKDFTGLTYEGLNQLILKLLPNEVCSANPLFEIVARHSKDHPEEPEFVDRVSRNLREGRFLLLIVGDGVRDDAASLAKYVTHHSLRYTLGIVQVRFFKLPDGSFLALPDIMAATERIERHVTVVTTQNGTVSVTGSEPPATCVTESKTSLSLDGFFDHLTKVSPGDVGWVRELIQSVADLPINPKVGSNGDTLMLKGALSSGHTPGLISFNPPNAEFWGVNYGGLKKAASGPALIRSYLEQVVRLLPGSSIRVFEKSGDMDIRINGAKVPIDLLHGKEAEIRAAMSDLLRAANAAQED